MAEFTEEEEAQHLISQSHQIPSPPKLPREVRDLIYYHALLRPRNSPSVTATHICYFHTKVPADDDSASASKQYWTPYWRTREPIRLFLVNRQTSTEALELLYSTYRFHFSQSVDIALVDATRRFERLCRHGRGARLRGSASCSICSVPLVPPPSVTRRSKTGDRRRGPVAECEASRVDVDVCGA